MKKLLFLTVILGTMTFGASTTPSTSATSEILSETQKEAIKEVKDMVVEKAKMFMDDFSEEDKAKIKANREEIEKLRKEANPDWDKIQKLSDENALIGSKARVEMMKAHPDMQLKDILQKIIEK